MKPVSKVLQIFHFAMLLTIFANQTREKHEPASDVRAALIVAEGPLSGMTSIQ